MLLLSWLRCMKPNGPAIKGGCVTRRSTGHGYSGWYFSRKAVTVQAVPGQGGYGARFCRPGTNFIEHYACRGTSLIGAGNLSRYKCLLAGTGAVSRYKLSRSQKSVTVQDFDCVQMRVSGCKTITNLSWVQEQKQKAVTNNLPIALMKKA